MRRFAPGQPGSARLRLPPGCRRSSPRRWPVRRLRRRWVLSGLGLVVVAAAIVGVDVATRYLPAAAALQDGADALSRVRADLAGDVGALDSGRLGSVEAQLRRATADFGERSALFDSGWLAGLGSG